MDNKTAVRTVLASLIDARRFQKLLEMGDEQAALNMWRTSLRRGEPDPNILGIEVTGQGDKRNLLIGGINVGTLRIEKHSKHYFVVWLRDVPILAILIDLRNHWWVVPLTKNTQPPREPERLRGNETLQNVLNKMLQKGDLKIKTFKKGLVAEKGPNDQNYHKEQLPNKHEAEIQMIENYWLFDPPRIEAGDLPYLVGRFLTLSEHIGKDRMQDLIRLSQQNRLPHPEQVRQEWTIPPGYYQDPNYNPYD